MKTQKPNFAAKALTGARPYGGGRFLFRRRHGDVKATLMGLSCLFAQEVVA